MKKNRNKSLPGGLWLVKNRLMMRMTIVLLLFLSFTAVAQNVTVKMKNSSFIQVAKEIQKQTELTFLYNDGSHNFTYTSSDNNFSVDLNGFISAMYQWEWFMHDAEVIWGLFDFYGVRSSDMVYQETTSQWNNTFSYYYGERGDDFTLRITQVRKGLNTNFTKIYKVYATNN